MADSTIGDDIYGGRFCFAGETVVASARSIFLLPSPSSEWQKALLGFGWLRDLEATGSPISQICARTLVNDWILLLGLRHRPSFEPSTVARRLISWLSHASFILRGVDGDFRKRFLLLLDCQTRFLRRVSVHLPHDSVRLLSLIALNFSALCLSGYKHLQPAFARLLDEELSHQILPDGGHISRHPDVIVDLLFDLLSLRRTFIACGIAPSLPLLSAIDRMVSMVRFFRHGDGGLVAFNGVRGPRTGDLAAILAQDEAQAEPVGHAVHSGYIRMSRGNSLVILDAGLPPLIRLSDRVHASCGAFELSVGRQRVIVSCGKQRRVCPEWDEVSRLTAAHSAAVLDDASSCRFIHCFSCKPGEEKVFWGPEKVEATLSEQPEGAVAEMMHDGYRREFGLLCRRKLFLQEDGEALFGEDLFERRDFLREDAQYAIRFHLYPDVRVHLREQDGVVVLLLPEGELWAMAVRGVRPTLEESVYLPRAGGPCRSRQIVIRDSVKERPRLLWAMRKMHDSGRQ